MLDVLLEAARIDPTDRCPAASHAPLAANFRLKWKSGRARRLLQATISGRLLAYARDVATAARWRSCPAPSGTQGAVAVVALSSNQASALDPVAEALQRLGTPTDYYRSEGAGPSSVESAGDLDRLRFSGALWSLLYAPCLAWRWLTSRGYAARSYRWAIDEYWRAYGLQVATRRWLRRERPSALVLSNDHLTLPVTLVAAAQDEGVPTFYLQHACVTDNFPPLTVDYALLDGRDALDKYAAAGASGSTAVLIGMPKSDAHADRVNNKPTLDMLGVCLSKADDLGRAEQLLAAVHAAGLGIAVTIRPHPATAAPVIARLQQTADRLGYAMSGREESAFAFLDRHDAIVSGVSSITLEAALLGVTPIHFVLNDDNADWYGFTDKGLCRSFAETNALVAYLETLREQREPPSRVAAYYCDTLGTSQHGHSAELAAGVIDRVRRNESLDGKLWRREDDANGMAVWRLQERAATTS